MSYGYGQYVFAGDGDDLVEFGDDWTTTRGHGGSGNDTFNLPVYGTSMKVYGGDGDDVFDTDREQTATIFLPDARLYGDAGNDKMTLLEFAAKMYGYGGTGDDKIVFSTNPVVKVVGNDGSDIVYGRDGLGMAVGPPSVQKIYGDETAIAITADADLAGVGGDDKIYGGSDMQANIQYVGGPGSDLISVGGNIMGTVVVTGDNYDAPVMILTEDDTGLNQADGDDIITLGNNIRGTTKVYGQGGNDKIVGGRITSPGAPQLEFFYGGSGDDKIWLVSPGEIALDDYGTGSALGGLGNDYLYGTDGAEMLAGDEYNKADVVIGEMDLRGGDDVIRAYGGADLIQGGFGNDLIDGGDGADIVEGQFGDDTIYGGAGDDSIYGDDLASLMFGDDIIFAGEGADLVYGGQGDDKIYGGDDDDTLYGNSGEDIMYGDAGADRIDSGYGWDTIFGGDGCDTILARDGGDVVWLGDCEDGTAVGDQKV